MIILPEIVSIIFYLSISIYFTQIRPIYGILIAILCIFYDRITHFRTEDTKINWSNPFISSPFGGILNKNWYKRQKYTEGFQSDEIPKVIYQTWNSKELPSKMATCVEKLKKDNPEFEYHFYDDQDCRKFIQTNFEPDVLKAYDSLIPGAFKADLWRYCVLYIKGGVYLDIKFQCEPGFSLKEIVKNNNFYVREYNHKGTGLYDHIIYTGCIVSKPNNPLLHRCIRQIVENCETKYYGPEHTSPTGPYLFASMMDADDLENCEYAYYEENGVGYIRNIESKRVILSHYPEYRKEQKENSKSVYWKDAWINKEIYV